MLSLLRILLLVQVISLLSVSTAMAGIITGEHRLVEAERIAGGGAKLKLSITLTNNGGKDIDHIHFLLADQQAASVLSRMSPLQIDKLPGGQSVTVNWRIEGTGTVEQWQRGHSFHLTGQGVVDGGTMVPLQVFCNAVAEP